VASQINFDNIFEMIDSYGNPDYIKMINEIVSQYNHDLHFEKEGSYNNRQDQELQMMIGLYFATFKYFKEYLDSYRLLNRSGNKDVDRINNSMTSYIFDSVRVCLVSISTANHPLFLRTVRELYESIVIAIAINQIDEKGQYVLLSSFNDKVSSVSYRPFTEKLFVKDLKSNLKKGIDDRTFFNFNVSSFTDDLEWTYPIFKMIDPYHKKVKLKKSDDSGTWGITVLNLANLLDIKGYDIVEFETLAYKHISILEHFSDSINPTVHKMSFENEINDLYIANIQRIRESCKSASIFITHVIDSFFYAIAIPQRLSLILSNLVRVITYTVPNNLMSSFKDDFAGLYEELPGITYKDSKFMEILKENLDIISDNQKDKINKYFSTYKDKFLVTNDVYTIGKTIEGDEHSCTNITIKYMNVFRSLLFGLRYYKDNDLPSLLTAKHTFMGYPKSVANKKAFLTDELVNYQESNIDVLTLSLIQGVANLCNSALLGANISFLEEARLLYESIILKTYLNIKFKDDDCVVDKYFEESAKTIMAQHKVISLRDKIIQDDLNNHLIDSSMKKTFAMYNDMYSTNLSNHFLFSVCEVDGIESFDDMLKYLSGRDIYLHLSSFDKFYNQKSFEILPYINKANLTDNEVKLTILDLSLLVFKCFKYDSFLKKVGYEKLTDVIQLGIYMINCEMKFIMDV
jgi:hypothetical protein